MNPDSTREARTAVAQAAVARVTRGTSRASLAVLGANGATVPVWDDLLRLMVATAMRAGRPAHCDAAKTSRESQRGSSPRTARILHTLSMTLNIDACRSGAGAFKSAAALP